MARSAISTASAHRHEAAPGIFPLPLVFDAVQMRREIEALPQSAWAEHPTDYEGNSSVRLSA